MKTISILAWNRPHYLAQCLEALAKCRGLKDYGILISVDGGGDQVEIPAGLDAEVVYLKESYGIDEHNFVCYEALFKHGAGNIELNVALEDDVILTPDALELANWYGDHMEAPNEYLFMSLGDPFYRKEWPKGDRIYNELHETGSIYTSAWCFNEVGWQWMREHWNRRLKTQIGWDFSLSFAMWEAKRKSLYPLVSRARNIGREGVHAYPEFFDKNVAPAIYSLDQTKAPGFEITYEMDKEPVPDWITAELAAKEDRYAELRNK